MEYKSVLGGLKLKTGFLKTNLSRFEDKNSYDVLFNHTFTRIINNDIVIFQYKLFYSIYEIQFMTRCFYDEQSKQYRYFIEYFNILKLDYEYSKDTADLFFESLKKELRQTFKLSDEVDIIIIATIIKALFDEFQYYCTEFLNFDNMI